MKCKYCKTKIGFFEWLFGLGQCYPCECESKKRKGERIDRDSEKYWSKQKGGKKKK